MKLFVVTDGTTDLQLLLDVGGQPCRAPMRTRLLHQTLLNNCWSSALWVDKKNIAAACCLPELPEKSKANDELGGLLTASSSPILFAAKLAPMMAGIDPVPDGALVLNTWRDENFAHSLKEPIAAGPFLCQWLASLGGCATGASALDLLFDRNVSQAFGDGSRFLYLNYIVGREDQSAPSTERSALSRVHDALITAWEEGFDSVVVADTGGLPAYKEAVRLCATLVFGEDKVEAWRNAEPPRRGSGTPKGSEQPRVVLLEDQNLGGNNATLPGPQRDQPRKLNDAVESELRLRLLAIELLRRGDFEAADSVANVTSAAWAKGLMTAAHVITGMRREYAEDIKDYWVPGFEGEHLPAPLVVAFRVESALRRGAWPEAITRTVEFFEWAFFLALEKKLNTDLASFYGTGVIKISIEPDRAIKGLALKNWQNINNHLNLLLVKQYQRRNGSTVRCFSTEIVAHRSIQHVLISYEFTDSQEIPSRMTVGNMSNEKRIWTNRFDAPVKCALNEVETALGKVDAHELSPIDYRNAQAHSGLTLGPGDRYSVWSAVQAFMRAGLWNLPESFDRPVDRLGFGQGCLFLAQPLVANVLHVVCDVEEASNKYANWINNLTAYVRHTPFEQVTTEPQPSSVILPPPASNSRAIHGQAEA